MAPTPAEREYPELVLRLLEKARGGSRNALGELLELHRSLLRGVAERELSHDLRRKEESADLVQEALLKAQRDFASFRGSTPDQFRAWLLAIQRHSLSEFARRYRSAGRDVDREESLDNNADLPIPTGQLPPGIRSPFRNAIHEERVVLLTGALSRVSERDRNVVIWRHEEGCTFEEIGRRLGCSVVAAHKAWCRALNHLRQELEVLSDDSSVAASPPRPGD